MAAKDFMKLNDDNTITIDFNGYNGNAFIDATKVLDIVKVKILSSEERKGLQPGSPDVKIQYASGGVGLISRKDLTRDFKHISGKKVIIPYMKNGVEYTLIRKCNEPYGVMLLAANLRGYLNGNNINPGSYIVAPRKEDGTLDMSRVAPISRKIFKKMFVIPMQDVIKRNTNNKGYVSSRVASRKRSRNAAIKQEVFNRGGNVQALDFGLNPNNINIPSINDSKKQSGLTGGPILEKKNTPVNTKPTKYNFRAVGRIVREDGVCIGFIIESISGERKNISYNNVMRMCSEHKIANIMLSKNDMGKYYLRGNGCRLEDLPKFLP